MQSIILAAGMGKRLKELTNNSTKCMVKVNNVTMIEQSLRILDKKNLSRIVIVVGYMGDKLISFVNSLNLKTPVVFVSNDVYDKTNNIFSLYLAKDYLCEDDTLLLESDLVFEEKIIDKMLDNSYKDLVLVDKYESWMDGTVITIGEDGSITNFISKKEFDFNKTDNYYKTVNIYKFSKEFSKEHYLPFLEAYCSSLGRNEYYEQVLKVLIYIDTTNLKALPLDHEKWYEIDDEQDLDIAESIFCDKATRLKKLHSRFGGYWRYPHLKDFCYLVNPFFPSKKLVDEMKNNFLTLLTNYPSGMGVNSLVAAKNFGLKQEQVVIGNGAAELIKTVIENTEGKLGIIYPTFEEYPNRKNKNEIVAYIPQNKDFSYTAEDIINYYSQNKVELLTLINPDNPSGNFIKKEDLLHIVEWADNNGIKLIVDESFADFAEDTDISLLKQDIIKKYTNLIVVKSISKSFGVPGIRLGILASGDKELISFIKKDVSIWNINSFGEFYMQIYEKYKSDYEKAKTKFKEVRADYIKALSTIKNLRVIPSQANYVTCEILSDVTACSLAEDLLDKYEILIKDLKGKKGIPNDKYIRIAVKTKAENDMLCTALKEFLD